MLQGYGSPEPMNLRQIEVFRTVMETGSVTEAAQRLNVSQPAVSKMLAQLEFDLGFHAFLREKRRLVPTQEAHALHGEIERAFVSLDYLKRFARDLAGLRQGHLVIGATHAVSGAWLPKLVADFLKRLPGTSISLQVQDSPKIAQAVAIGHLDLGIVQYAVDERQTVQERLLEVEAVCVVPPGHRLEHASFIEPEDLQGEAFVALSAGNRMRTAVDALMEKRGVSRRIQIDTPLASSACSFVMAGLGVSIMGRLSAVDNLHRGIVIRPFRPRVTQDLLMLQPARRAPSLLAAELAAHLRRHFDAATPSL